MADRVVTSARPPHYTGPLYDGRMWEWRAVVAHQSPVVWAVYFEARPAGAGAYDWEIVEGDGRDIRASRDEAVARAHVLLDDLAFVPSSEVVQAREASRE